MVDHAGHRAKVGLSLVGGVRLDLGWHQIGHIPWVTINSCDRRGSRNLWLLAQTKANQAELKLGSYAVANPAANQVRKNSRAEIVGENVIGTLAFTPSATMISCGGEANRKCPDWFLGLQA